METLRTEQARITELEAENARLKTERDELLREVERRRREDAQLAEMRETILKQGGSHVDFD